MTFLYHSSFNDRLCGYLPTSRNPLHRIITLSLYKKSFQSKTNTACVVNLAQPNWLCEYVVPTDTSRNKWSNNGEKL